MRAVLVLRPEPEAADTGRRVRELGWTPIVSPLLEIKGVEPEPFAMPDAVVVSSPRAVLHAPDALLAVPAFAVGTRTADAWAARGGRVEATTLDGARLAPRLPTERRLLHVGGREVAFDFRIPRLVVYEAQARSLLPEARAALLSGRATALLTSPRIAALLAREGTHVRALAMSEAVAAAWPGQATVASEPTIGALLHCLGQPSGEVDRSS